MLFGVQSTHCYHRNKHSAKETRATAELTPVLMLSNNYLKDPGDEPDKPSQPPSTNVRSEIKPTQRPVLTLSNNYLEDPDDDDDEPDKPSQHERSEKKPTKKTPMLPPTGMKKVAEMPPLASSGAGSDGVYMALCKVEKRGPGHQENNQYMSLCNTQQREGSSPMMQRSLIAGEGKGDTGGALYMNYNHKEQQKVAVEAYCMGVVSPGRPECREAPVYMNQKQMAGAGAKKTSLPAAQVTRKYETPAYVNLKLKQSH